jgi:hypothetical protein
VKLLIALIAALAFPAAALAEDARLVAREVALRGERSLASAPPPVFHLVGLHWQGPGDVFFRTRTTSGRWSTWRHAQPSPLDVPDAGTGEGRSALTWKLGNPYWVGASNAIQYRPSGRVDRLRAHFVSSSEKAVPVRTLSIAGSPPVAPRAAWGANESIRRGGTTYAQALRFGVVHHTAGSNSYTAAQSAAIVRAVQTYHVKGNGWNDIGYNFLVDKYGQVFEGRYGGVDRNVVGAHAEGFNTGSVGVALLGSYGTVKPTPAALDAIAALLAWRLDVGHVDPLARLSWISGGNARFPSGTPAPLATISGHRDTGFTACPGNALYAQLPAIARRAAAIGLPKLYDPVVTGRPGSPVRFTARLSSSLPWSVRVTDGEGNAVAAGSGNGQTVDWTWDATPSPTGRYLYAIEAGADVRPATGAVGQTPSTLSLTGAQARPATFTPNGDSQADSTVISYALSLPATVTATLRDPFGQTLATLFSEQKPAGRQSFRFTASGIADGRYTIVLAARGATGTESRMEIPVVIDRTLAAFAAKPPVFSPNGDRRLDQLTFGFVLAAPARMKLHVAGGPTVFEGDLQPGPHEFRWEERLRDGRYAAVLEATGPFGRRAQTARFSVDTRKPKLRVLSARARRFSVDERVTITGTIGGLRVQAVVGPGRFTLSGAGGRIAITAWDFAGNRSTLRHR